MKEKVGRLAFRREGLFWNCYLAGAESMEGSYYIGSILHRVIDENDEIKQRFMAVMRETLVYIVKEALGEEVEVGDEEPAPEKDRTKPT